MLLLLFTLFSYDVINCFNETIVKEKFNESSLLSKYRHNFLEVQAFIIDAQHKFHGNQTAEQGDNTHRLTRFKEVDRPPVDSLITGELDQKTLQTSIPLLRSRPVFPGSITPFTTELNARHLDWDKIFPVSTVQTKPDASRLALRAPGIPTSSPGPSSTEPEHYELSYPSFSVSPRDFVWNMSTVRTVKPSATTNTTLAPIKYINDEVMNLWLQEITTFSPVDKLMNTLTSTDNGYTQQYSHDQSKSPVKTRNFHTKVRRRKPHHHSYKQNRRRQRYRHRNSREDIYRRQDREEENPLMRRKNEMDYRRRISTDKKKRGSKRKRQQINTFLPRLVIGSSDSEEPEEAFDSSNEMSQLHHYHPEDEIHIKRIGKRDESRHKGVQRRAQKEKLFKELMERLKAVESRKKAKQMMLKADRLRKIVEGSSYSDEEEPLKKNLILALNYGNRT